MRRLFTQLLFSDDLQPFTSSWRHAAQKGEIQLKGTTGCSKEWSRWQEPVKNQLSSFSPWGLLCVISPVLHWVKSHLEFLFYSILTMFLYISVGFVCHRFSSSVLLFLLSIIVAVAMTVAPLDSHSPTRRCLPASTQHATKTSKSSLSISGTKVEIPWFCQEAVVSVTDLADGQAVSLGADHLHLDPIHQTLQLVPDIPGSSHGAELDEVLIAPLCGVTALHPLRENNVMTAVSRISQGYWVFLKPMDVRLCISTCGPGPYEGLQDESEGLWDE